MLKELGMSSDTVPFVAGELLREGCCYSDRVSKLPNTMDNTYYATSENLGGNGVDRYHFNHDAYVTFGKRYAEQMLKAVVRTPVEPVPQQPFGKIENGEAVAGEVAVIPGKIEAENYDITGIGSGNSSYKDDDSENKGKAYRNDGVDIEAIADGFAVGYTNEGEWLEYSVNVKASGDYAVKARLASGSETSGFQLLLDDKELASAFTAPKTGEDWKTYEEVDVGEVKLTEGKHVFKILITGNYVNIDWLEFADKSSSRIVGGKLQARNEPRNYKVFDPMGICVGSVRAMDANEAVQQAKMKIKGMKNLYVKAVAK
jgi:hypothetical protein